MKKLIGLAVTSIAMVLSLAGCSVQQAAVSVNHGLTSGANDAKNAVTSVTNPNASDETNAEAVANGFAIQFFTFRGWKVGDPIPGDTYMTTDLRTQFDQTVKGQMYAPDYFNQLLKKAGSANRLPKVSSVNLSNVQQVTGASSNGTAIKAYSMTVTPQYDPSGISFTDLTHLFVEVGYIDNQWQIFDVETK